METQRTYQVGSSTLSLEFGDITASKADVLVSSDDSNLTMGGGVSAAIGRAAGQGILLEVAKRIPAKLGDVVVTSAGALPAKYVFHAITIGEGTTNPSEVVSNATRRSMNLLRELGLFSIAFPAIGSGVAGFALEDVAANMAEVIVEELGKSSEPLRVTIYLFDRFGRMKEIDYVQFFEEVAVRSRGLGTAPAKPPATPEATVTRPREPKPNDAEASARSRVLTELADLDRERQKIEERLAQYGDALANSDVADLEGRLRHIQENRIALLSNIKSKPSSAVSVFISYSHVDEPFRVELGKHLSVLERLGVVASWYDRMIGAGSEWEGVIDARLSDARVILLLISSDFIHSKYCYDVEMTQALALRDKRQALVIPVILREVYLDGTPFASLQALPKDGKPVVEWKYPDAAYRNITEGLRNAIQDLPAAK